jgi:hypothetical protein
MVRRILTFIAVLAVPLSLIAVSALPARADESPPTLSPSQGQPGTNVTASATDWPGCSSMSVSGWGRTLGTAAINSAGAFSLSFTVPSDAPLGAAQLMFSPTCMHSAIAPFVTFTVTPGAPGAPSTSVPAAPSNLTVTAVDPNDIRLNWQDNSSNETGFQINNGVITRDVGANSTTYTWDGLAPGTYMCFHIRAYNSAGDSAWEPDVSPYYVCTTTPKPQSQYVTATITGRAMIETHYAELPSWLYTLHPAVQVIITTWTEGTPASVLEQQSGPVNQGNSGYSITMHKVPVNGILADVRVVANDGWGITLIRSVYLSAHFSHVTKNIRVVRTVEPATNFIYAHVPDSVKLLVSYLVSPGYWHQLQVIAAQELKLALADHPAWKKELIKKWPQLKRWLS